MHGCTFLYIFDLRILGAAIWTIIPAARTKNGGYSKNWVLLAAN